MKIKNFMKNTKKKHMQRIKKNKNTMTQKQYPRRTKKIMNMTKKNKVQTCKCDLHPHPFVVWLLKKH